MAHPQSVELKNRRPAYRDVCPVCGTVLYHIGRYPDKERLFEGLDEERLTKEVIMPLLERKGLRRVRYCHGVDEFGRDVLFEEEDKWGSIRYCAGQVKAVRIHGGAGKSKGNVQELINQAQAAFDNPFWDSSSNENRYINELYIFAGKGITPSAKTAILNGVRNKNIRFIDEQELADQWLKEKRKETRHGTGV